MDSFLLYKAEPRVTFDAYASDLRDALSSIYAYDFDGEEVYQTHVRPSVVTPLGRMARHVQHQLAVPEAWGMPELVSCRWAGPHVDAEWRGTTFVSVVLHTGPYPFQVSLFSTNPSEGATAGIQRSGRIVESGDVLVFDPTVAHCAFPLCPDRESLLVLLQWAVNTTDADALSHLKAVVPPCAHDREQFRFSEL